VKRELSFYVTLNQLHFLLPSVTVTPTSWGALISLSFVFVCKDVDKNKRGKMKHNQDETEAKQGKREKGDSSENEIRACGQ
jgi:hypothetical protein